MIDWSPCPAAERNPEVVSGVWVFSGMRAPIAALFERHIMSSRAGPKAGARTIPWADMRDTCWMSLALTR